MDMTLKIFWNSNPTPIDQKIESAENVFEIPLGALITSPSLSVPVTSVNGKLGDVELTYIDVDAEPLGAVLNLQSYVDHEDDLLQDQIDLKADAQAVNQALSTKADLDSNGKVPSSQLPSYVDDVVDGRYISPIRFDNISGVELTPEDDKIYVDVDTNKTYRWSGMLYVLIGGGGVALGETSETAYRGDRGKIAYDHSLSQGNPHNTTTSEINEGSKLFFTEQRARDTVLTGLNTSAYTPVVATDTILQAIGKLEAKSSGGSSEPVWVSAQSIGTLSPFLHSNTILEFANIGGLLWVRGYVQVTQQISAGQMIFSVTDPNYKLKVLVPNASDYAQTHAEISVYMRDNVYSMLYKTNANSTNQTLYAGSAITTNDFRYYNHIQPTCLGQIL